MADEPDKGSDRSENGPGSRPVRGRLNRARAELEATRADLSRAVVERDDARAERDAARREVDAANDALALARADREQLRAELAAQQEQAAGDLAAEVRDIHALLKKTDRRSQFMPRELLTDIQAMLQLFGRYAPEARLPLVAGWALSPAGLLAVADVIETRDAKTVVECGSGTSTLWIGYALRKLGRGKVIALDHLPEYAEATRAIVAAHGLEDYVEVRLAPLAPRQTPRGEFSWYSFDPGELSGPIDVLLVDGPPGTTGPHARYPALPVFADSLAPHAVIIADDMHRRDEQEMVQHWLGDEPRLRRIETPGAGIEVLGLTA